MYLQPRSVRQEDEERSGADDPEEEKRREELCLKFAHKSASNPLFAKWYPLKTSRTSSRTVKKAEVYKETKARCERLKNSPFFYFRRILNGKEGKSYGKRYAEYRDI